MNRKSTQWIPFLFIGAAAGVGAAWLIRKRRQQMQALPQPAGLPAEKVILFTVAQRMLAERRGAAQAHSLLEATRQKYAELCLERPVPTRRVMRMHLYENILPGLALYQVLLAAYEGQQQAALAEIDEIFRVWTTEKVSKRFGTLLALPIPFGLFKWMANLLMKAYPPEGWDITYAEANDSRLAFNITRCFYLNTLKALNAPELTASFCKTDDVMAEQFPETVRFVRPHTLGRGDAQCDFQYCRAVHEISEAPQV